MEENKTEYCNGLRIETFEELKPQSDATSAWYYNSVPSYGAPLNNDEEQAESDAK